jgi:hypothetical protein
MSPWEWHLVPKHLGVKLCHKCCTTEYIHSMIHWQQLCLSVYVLWPLKWSVFFWATNRSTDHNRTIQTVGMYVSWRPIVLFRTLNSFSKSPRFLSQVCWYFGTLHHSSHRNIKALLQNVRSTSFPSFCKTIFTPVSLNYSNASKNLCRLSNCSKVGTSVTWKGK